MPTRRQRERKSPMCAEAEKGGGRGEKWKYSVVQFLDVQAQTERHIGLLLRYGPVKKITYSKTFCSNRHNSLQIKRQADRQSSRRGVGLLLCDDTASVCARFSPCPKAGSSCEKYPSVVSLPGGCRSEVMSLSHPKLPSCVVFIHWSVEVSREGEVTPKINLLTKIPERALQFFPSQVVGSSAEAFQSLLRILGPEAAMESVIRAVSLSEDT
ncbi:hypothetical protein Q8A73_006036 [Channa argus]|nr:hypothetical protein Q8A73_006036 [Channa argus]